MKIPVYIEKSIMSSIARMRWYTLLGAHHMAICLQCIPLPIIASYTHISYRASITLLLSTIYSYPLSYFKLIIQKIVCE